MCLAWEWRGRAERSGGSWRQAEAPEGRAAAHMLTTPCPVPTAHCGSSAPSFLMRCPVHSWMRECGILMAKTRLTDRAGSRSHGWSPIPAVTCAICTALELHFSSPSLKFPNYGKGIHLLPAP